MTDACYEPRPVATRRPPTYELLRARAYGYAMATLATIGPASTSEVTAFLADRLTPYSDDEGGALGIGWYPMSVARLLTQIRLHGYPVRRDAETGLWTLGKGGSREVRDAIADCYRLAAIDDRPRRASRSY